MKRPLFIGGCALAAMLISAMPAVTGAQAQGFPSKAVRVVVTTAPGGNTDIAARGLAQRLVPMWGQPVVVENRPGAGGTIAAAYVAGAAPDGYTLLYAPDGTYVITPPLYSKLSYHPLTSFAPITVPFRSSSILVLSNAVPVKNFREFLAYARANPGKLSYGSYGYGSNAHVAIEQLKQMAGLELVHVPYEGGGPALTDLIAGRVALLLGNLAFFEPHEKEGKLKIIAALDDKRMSVRPDLPTVSESGVPGYSVSAWSALVAPAGTPASVLDKIRADIVTVLRDPDFNEKFMKQQGFRPEGNSREEFASMLRTEYAHWGRIVRTTGAKLD